MPPPPLRVLKRLHLKGYKSFREINIELRPINILIGANGAGKSNFISLFKMLRQMMLRELQLYVERQGGASALFHYDYGPKETQEIWMELWFEQGKHANGYRCILSYASDKLFITNEAIAYHDKAKYDRPLWKPMSTQPRSESLLPTWEKKYKGIARRIYQDFQSWEVYHFHDTSESARIKQHVDINQNDRLWNDAGNLAAYLYFLRELHPDNYEDIVRAVRYAAPFFKDFHLRLSPFSATPCIRLEWQAWGSDRIFGPESLSGGTLRFMCLATLFLQPSQKQPSVILIDEPELGLHPYALGLLAEMVQSVAHEKQVIMTTQSPFLIDRFEPEDVLVVNIEEGASTISRLERQPLEEWLKEYSLGELWTKNVLRGNPEYIQPDDLPF